jgi:hypothetical protein
VVFKQEVNIPLALTIGLISGIMLLVMTFGMQAWYENAEQAIIAEKLVDAPKSDFVQLKDDQADSIRHYGWADASHSRVRIPIAKAMELMVKYDGKLPATQPTSQPSNQPAPATQPTASVDAGK